MDPTLSTVEAFLIDPEETKTVPELRTLEDLRPRALKDFIGNEGPKNLFARLMVNNSIPRRAFFYGPSGSGKTTLVHILAHFAFCLNRRGKGDNCGQCPNCVGNLDCIQHFHEWTGADLDEQWNWWVANRTSSFLDNPCSLFFIDESQGIPRHRQKEMHRWVETFRGILYFATTHKHEMDDALINRFSPYIIELRRPTVEQAVTALDEIGKNLGVTATQRHLTRIAEHYACDLRKCVCTIDAAEKLTQNKVVTDDLLNMLLGEEAAVDIAQASQSHGQGLL